MPAAGGADRFGRPWNTAQDIEDASALVYVSEECPYCRSELAHWAALRAADGEIPLWIVASPTSEVEELDWVPETLRERVVSDTEGAVGRALGVPAVPVTLWIDSAGVVRGQRLGASSSRQIREEFRRLIDSNRPSSEPHFALPDLSSPGGPR